MILVARLRFAHFLGRWVLSGRLLSRPLFESLLGLPNLFQPRLAALQLVGQLLARLVGSVEGVLSGIGLLRVGQHLFDLGGNLFLGLLHAAPAHALCLEALAFIFVPSSATRPSFIAPASPAPAATLLKELFQRFQVDFAETRDGAEVGLVAGRQHPKRHVLEKPLGDLARGAHPQAVAVDEQLHHQPRMIGRLPRCSFS